jgi:hypothetical protein
MGKSIKEFFHYWVENMIEARERHEFIMWLIFAATLAGTVIFKLSDPHGTEAKISGWLLIAVLVWAMLWFPFKRHQSQEHEYKELEESIKPKLKVEAQSIRSEFPLRDVKVNYFRFVLENKGAAALKNCRGILQKIEESGIDKMGGESVFLKFQSGDDDSESSKTLYNGAMAYLDVMVTVEDNSILIPTAATGLIKIPFGLPASMNLKEIFKKPGSYRLEVLVVNQETASVKIESEFVWTGDWRTSDLKLIKTTLLLPSLKRVGA